MTNIQERCENTAKMLGVSLAFFIPISTTLTQILLLLIFLALCGAGQWRAPIQFLYSHPVARAAFWLVIVFCLGIIYSEASFKDSLSMLNKMSKMIYIPLLLPLFMEAKWRKYAMIAFLMAMLLSLLLNSLKTYQMLPTFISLTRYHDCAFKNHIDTNLLMSMAAFFLAHTIWIEVNRFRKIIPIILLMCMIYYVLWVSEGRTGYIIFAALWMLCLLQRATLKQGLIGFMGLLALLAATTFTPSGMQHRFHHMWAELQHYQQVKSEHKNNQKSDKSDRGDQTDQADQKPTNLQNSVRQRLEFIQSSFAIVKQKPWLGFGTGGFKIAYARYAQEHQREATTNPHNEYFNILVQWGLLGLLAFLAFVWTLFKTSLLLPTTEKYLAQGVIFAILVGCLGNSFLMDFTSGFFFVTFISMMMAALPMSVSMSMLMSMPMFIPMTRLSKQSVTKRAMHLRKVGSVNVQEGLLP